MLIVTPYMDEAERCTRIAFMEDGRILLDDTPTALKARVPHPYSSGGDVDMETTFAYLVERAREQSATPPEPEPDVPAEPEPVLGGEPQ